MLLPLAHGLVQRANLPIPEWLFGWAAGVVLLVSFAALAVLWPEPKLEGAEPRPTAGRFGRFIVSRPVRIVCGATGFALLVVVVWAGFAGKQLPTANFAPTFVYVIFWVGLVAVSVVFGDVFRAFNPWAGPARLLLGERARRAYPERLGRWPAAAGLLCFTWLELAAQTGDEPRNLAIAAVVYSVATWAAMAVYGVRPWLDRGEAFSVYFNLFSRISPFEARDGRLQRRRVLSALTRLDPVPGTVALLSVMIGTVTFDGFSEGPIWRDAGGELQSAFESAGLSIRTGQRLTATIGMAAAVLVVAGFYRLGVRGARSVGGNIETGELARAFVHSLAPIAVVYVAAHYLTLLIFQGQAIVYLASDPLGHGWDLFGTADNAINYALIGQNVTWYLQVGFVVAGHVAALTLAHDRALVLYPNSRLAVRSQYWMLGVMIGFTTLALYLLAKANA
jgi:hypothetical protein